MWGISLRECTQSVHKRNKSFIKRELRLRGITLHPDSDPVVRLPPGSLWNVTDVKRVFRKTLVVSYIPLCVCDFLLDRLRVIRLEPPTVGSVLDNGRSWTRRINEVEDIVIILMRLCSLPWAAETTWTCLLPFMGVHWPL